RQLHIQNENYTMKTIHFTDPHRRRHFEFFNRMDQPHFGVTMNLDVTKWMRYLKSNQLPFTPTMVYNIAFTANQIPAFRYRIRGQVVVEHEVVHPSFTVKTDVSEVFSFCTVEYAEKYEIFKARALDRMEAMRVDPSFEDEPGRDDYLFLSAAPWVSFTSVQHAMHYSPADSVPRIVWGKIFEEGSQLKMPFSITAHHAVVDGMHVGQYVELIQSVLDGSL
ncbi:MAG: CatA-like O-acetyltransferase, partial [Bacteroidota bacterium]